MGVNGNARPDRSHSACCSLAASRSVKHSLQRVNGEDESAARTSNRGQRPAAGDGGGAGEASVYKGVSADEPTGPPAAIFFRTLGKGPTNFAGSPLKSEEIGNVPSPGSNGSRDLTWRGESRPCLHSPVGRRPMRDRRPEGLSQMYRRRERASRPISRVLCGGFRRPATIPLGRRSRDASSNPPERPTRRRAGGFPPRRSYSVLLPVGFALPPPLLEARWALTPPFHPYPRAEAEGGLFSVALSLGSPPPGVTRHRFSVEPGLSSPAVFRHVTGAAARPAGGRDVARAGGPVKRRSVRAAPTTLRAQYLCAAFS